jgi:hypothetical protein
MPSCTNNSIISGIIVGSVDSINGRRLSFQQKTDTNWDPTIIAGNVIRYDVDAGVFTQSIADPNFEGAATDMSLAEVVGIVESIAVTDGITYATVVTHGLINYPNLMSTIAGISATSGGDGGTDIFFLSPDILGGITYGLIEDNGYIVKPILQVCPISGGDFNSIVVNYIGYESSSSANASFRSSEVNIGEIRVVDAASVVPDGWVDTSSPKFLSITEYPEAYATYGNSYGTLEKLYVNGSFSFVDALAQKSIRPINPQTNKGIGLYSSIVSVDTTDNSIIVEHTDGNPTLWKSNYTTYQISEAVLGLSKVTVTSGAVTEFKTPQIQTNIQATANVKDQISTFATKTIIRVKKDNVVSYLPQYISFANATVNGVLATPNFVNVDSTLVSLESRIQALEQILGIS